MAVDAAAGEVVSGAGFGGFGGFVVEEVFEVGDKVRWYLGFCI